MIYSTITEKEEFLLKFLIGQKLICFKSEQKDSWNKIFGNISIVTENSEIEIKNELSEILYFDTTEDVSKFKIQEVSQESPFRLMVESPIVKTAVDEKIKNIFIAQDKVSVKDSENKTIYEITMDEAIIIETEKSTFVISREWHLEEELIFVKSTDYKKDIYPIEKVISDWSDEDSIKTNCTRTYINLGNKKYGNNF